MTGPGTSPESTRLAAGLRELRKRTGLSLAGLAARTTFSKSSWERYLNGRTLPPRPAVQELCRLADESDGRYLALRELAQQEWSEPPEPPCEPAETAPPATPPLPTSPPAPVPAPVPVPAPADLASARHWWGVTAAAVLASVSALVFGALALTLVLLPHHRTEPSPSATGPHCRDAGCEGKDPAVMRCGALPETLAEHLTSTGASVQLRYSRECGTSWVRMWGARIGDGTELRGRVVRVRNRAEADTYVHTPMAATRSGTVVQACFLPATNGRKECFEAKVE
ncbi:helix-turn-helix domain-containing protein [Streptomyces rishiriensis]|uniref:helix-turn-helix domain-containing protein n=1 Tax=Streptomyces rishiriensis TaxID=68264 RepID=UPI0037BC5B08